MIIAGAGGLAVEIIQILRELDYDKPVVCFADNNPENKKELFPGIQILSDTLELQEWMDSNSSDFVVGIGNPTLRHQFRIKIEALGGRLCSIISPNSTRGDQEVFIGKGTIIFPGVRISNRVSIGENVLIYYNSVITHDIYVGNNVEISPSAVLLGGARIMSNVHIGANATILPKILINEGALIGAGAVVTKDVDMNSVMIGVPAKELVK